MRLLGRLGAAIVAINVEIANADMASICAVGAATFEHWKALFRMVGLRQGAENEAPDPKSL